jgi:Uma2 family endonuclease
MATLAWDHLPPEQRLLLHAITWQTYVAIGNALLDRHIFLAYDRGNLEIMTPSYEHERYKSLITRLIHTLTEECNIPIKSLGSTTQQREDLEIGLEPDVCFYLANCRRILGVRRLDLPRDPPPDLVLEVEVSRSSINRMSLFARLGVPEVWRFDRQTLHVHRLGSSSEYHACDHSPTFPTLPPSEIVHFMRLGVSENDTAMARAFRVWVRELLAKRPEKPTPGQ